jgi:hypothetical protein
LDVSPSAGVRRDLTTEAATVDGWLFHAGTFHTIEGADFIPLLIFARILDVRKAHQRAASLALGACTHCAITKVTRITSLRIFARIGRGIPGATVETVRGTSAYTNRTINEVTLIILCLVVTRISGVARSTIERVVDHLAGTLHTIEGADITILLALTRINRSTHERVVDDLALP